MKISFDEDKLEERIESDGFSEAGIVSSETYFYANFQSDVGNSESIGSASPALLIALVD